MSGIRAWSEAAGVAAVLVLLVLGMRHDPSHDEGVFAHAYRHGDEQHEKLKLLCRMYGVRYMEGTGRPGEIVARLR